MADYNARVQIAVIAELQEQQEIEGLLFLLLAQHQRRQRRRYWIKPWIQRRTFYGDFEHLMVELERESRGDFMGYMRMPPGMFHELVDSLSPRLTKRRTRFREPHSPGLKLAVTLRHLATGNSYRSLAYSFRVPHNTISKVVREVCQAIIEEYQEEVIVMPDTEEDWRDVASKFARRWDFHHALGALDGKHVAIKAPPNSGTLYHNYKGFFSVILLALVDSDYKFMWTSIGAHGSTSDCAVFNESPLKAAIEAELLNIPAAEPLPSDDQPVPYFIVGDDAFGLKTWMMKPFSSRNLTGEERIFNYRLSRARRIVENAFGILTARWRCLLTTMHQEPETVGKIVIACICLHNFMRLRYPQEQNAQVDREDGDHNVIPGAWRDQQVLQDIEHARRGALATREARIQRVYLKGYYNRIGAVPWQNDMI